MLKFYKFSLFISLLSINYTYAQTPCESGLAGSYPCEDLDLMSYLPFSSLHSGASSGNDSWGWTDPLNGNEYAIMGLNNGTVFVNITNAANPVVVGFLRSHNSRNSSWRDVKTYNNYAFIVSEAVGHGMQVFDLKRLRNVSSYTNFNVGAPAQYNAGPYFIDISNPLNPTPVGGFADDGYTHDAQVVTYNGPDTDYTGHEILIAANETDVTLVDVTDKSNPVQISTISYPNYVYTHQGWFTEDQRYFLLGDEQDETDIGFNTKTVIFDLVDLDSPVIHFNYYGPTAAIDHNGYVKGNRFYLANYSAGLRVLDISDIANQNITEIASFDTYTDGGNHDGATFAGAWNVYPFFESGNIVISGLTGGLYIVRDRKPTAVCQDITVTLDASGNASILAEDINNGSVDNNPLEDISIDVLNFTTDDLGDNPVILTVTDSEGQTDSCVSTVTVLNYVPVEFTYDGGIWSPNAPSLLSNPSTVGDNITVLNGNVSLLDAVLSKNITIASGATLNLDDNSLSLSGDLINNGTFNADTGTLVLNGSSDQDISGNPLTLSNIEIEGNSTKTLSTPISILGAMTLSEGILNTNNQLSFLNTYNELSQTHTNGMLGKVTGGAIVGNVLVQRYFPAKRAYRLVSSPVTTTTSIRENWQANGNVVTGFGTHITGAGGAANGFDATGTNNPSIFTLNTAAQNYEVVSNTNANTLNVGDAYLLLVRGDRTVDLTNNNATPSNTILETVGELHIGTYNASNISTVENGSSLIGNPYQASVDMELVLQNTTNLNQRYYHVYDPTINSRGAFVTVDTQENTNSLTFGGGISLSSANKYLQPSQAAFVNTTANGAASLQFLEDHKDLSGNGTNVFYTEIDQKSIGIALFNTNNELKDGTRIIFNEDDTNEITSLDALKNSNLDENLSTEINNQNFSIQRRALAVAGDEIQLSISGFRESNYIFKFQIEDFESETTVFLEDTFLDTFTPLVNNGETVVNFTVNEDNLSSAPDRFKLVFETNVLGTPNFDNLNSITLYPNPANDYIIISNPQSVAINSIAIYDLMGKKIISKTTDFNRVDISKLESALYLVEINSTLGTFKERLIVE
jgi:hypothetical protein